MRFSRQQNGRPLLLAALMLALPLFACGQARDAVSAPANAADSSQTDSGQAHASQANTSQAKLSKVHLPAMRTKAGIERAAGRATGRAAELNAEAATTVVLYRTAWCGYCKRAAAYMRQQKVPFVERDIEKNDDFQAEYRRLGGKGSVPLIQFGDKTMMGFAQEAFDQFYAEFEQSKSGKVLP